MKRDMDLVRKLLVKAEEIDPAVDGSDQFNVEGYSIPFINYHLVMMEEKGLINLLGGQRGLSEDDDVLFVSCLTWEGHEFLDLSRNDTIWNAAKDKVVRATGGLTFEAMKVALVQLGLAAVKGLI